MLLTVIPSVISSRLKKCLRLAGKFKSAHGHIAAAKVLAQRPAVFCGASSGSCVCVMLQLVGNLGI